MDQAEDEVKDELYLVLLRSHFWERTMRFTVWARSESHVQWLALDRAPATYTVRWWKRLGGRRVINRSRSVPVEYRIVFLVLIDGEWDEWVLHATQFVPAWEEAQRLAGDRGRVLAANAAGKTWRLHDDADVLVLEDDRLGAPWRFNPAFMCEDPSED